MASLHAAPLVSVIVPCKGHARELVDCLRSLAAQHSTFTYETIVVDSATDRQVAEAVDGRVGVRLIRSAANLRPGAARNRAAAAARGTYLAFLDADCRAAPDWLAYAVDRLEAGAHLVGGPVLDALPRNPIAVTDNLLQFADFAPGRSDGAAHYFPSCNMAIRRSDFTELGGFLEAVSAGEDTALCNTALARWPRGLAFVHDMRVLHTGRTEFGAFLRHQANHGYHRGLLRHHLTTSQWRWGARWIALPAAVLKRLGYIVKRNFQWRRIGLLRLALLLPLILIGLTAWANGFRRGCRA